jgi:TRAP-type C4-dicarboxylate transport system substrate-binding protein
MKKERTGKKFFFVSTVAMISIPVMLCLLVTRAFSAEKPIELRFTTVVTSIHPNFLSGQKFADEVFKRTNGKVKITLYPSGTLNPPFETYNAIKTGMAQMGMAPVGFSAMVMPLNKLFGDALRGLSTSTEASRAYQAALNSVPEMVKEFEGVHLLWVYSTLPMSVGTTKKPIKKLEDFKGLVMRFPPGLEVLAKSWGVSPINIPVGDIYVALQKGTVQGYIGGAEQLQSMRLAEHIKYVTSVDMIYGLSYVAMNKKVWDSLPSDVQKVFNDLSDWAQALWIKETDLSDQASLNFAKSQGAQMVTIDKAELNRIYKVSEPVFEKIAADLEARGKPGKKILAEVETHLSK